MPSLFVFVVFILFLFFSFYFFGLCSSDLTKKRERKGSFEVFFFSFFFLDSREDGSLSLSRLGEKEDFWIRGNSWESGIWLNLMGEFGSFGDFSYRFRGILVNRDRDLKKKLCSMLLFVETEIDERYECFRHGGQINVVSNHRNRYES